jgi:hypothetical protein
MSRKSALTEDVPAAAPVAEAAPAAAPAPAPAAAHPLPATGGAFIIVDGALVPDQNAAPPTRMPGDVAPETIV